MNIVWFSELGSDALTSVARIAANRLGQSSVYSSIVLQRIRNSMSTKYGVCLERNLIVSKKKFSHYPTQPNTWFITPNNNYSITRYPITVGSNRHTVIPLTEKDIKDMVAIARSFTAKPSNSVQAETVIKSSGNALVIPVVIYSVKQEFSQFFRKGTLVSDIPVTLARRGISADEDVMIMNTVNGATKSLFKKVVTTNITMEI